MNQNPFLCVPNDLHARCLGVGSAQPLIAFVVPTDDVFFNFPETIGLECKDAFISFEYFGDVVINVVLRYSQLCEIVRKIHDIPEMLLDVLTHRQRHLLIRQVLLEDVHDVGRYRAFTQNESFRSSYVFDTSSNRNSNATQIWEKNQLEYEYWAMLARGCQKEVRIP